MPSQKKLSARQRAEAWGIDVSLIEASLERTPTQRIMIHQSALETALLLQEAMAHAQFTKNSEKNSFKKS